MAGLMPKIFLSYRRSVGSFIARAIFTNLVEHGYDVFMDVESTDPSQFEKIILAQIATREYFLVILTPGTLERCQEPGDWLRREIEYVMDLNRNIIPILTNDFGFDNHIRTHLTGKLGALPHYNGLLLMHEYFDQAIENLRKRFLKRPGLEVIKPAPRQHAPIVKSTEAQDDQVSATVQKAKAKIMQVFLCHASEDKTAALDIYDLLKASGYKPWLDKKDLLPGQTWRREIRKAISASDFIVLFLSQTSVAKRGYVQQEFNFAWEILQEQPKGTIHTIPVRLNECSIPERFSHLHWCNLFELDGFENLLRALEAGRSSLR